MSKKTVIIGATPNPSRYAYLAAERLTNHSHRIIPLGIKKGVVLNKEIQDLRDKPEIPGVDTVTMYIGTRHQAEWEEYILSLKPKRIIFNPGTENPSLKEKAKQDGIETVEGCTLVMLSTGEF